MNWLAEGENSSPEYFSHLSVCHTALMKWAVYKFKPKAAFLNRIEQMRFTPRVKIEFT